MASPRKRAEVSVRRSEIVSLAMDLFARKGVQGVSIRDISDLAGILPGSLYTHFSSKLEILDLGLRPYTEVALADVREIATEDADPKSRLRVLLHRSFARMVEWREAAAVMHADWEFLSQQEEFAFVREFMTEVRAQWIRALHEAVESGALASDVEPGIAMRLVWQNMGAEVARFRPGGEYSPDLMADYLHRMLFGGLSSPRDGRSSES